MNPWRIYKKTKKGWIALKRTFPTKAKAYRAFVDRNCKTSTHCIQSNA